MCGIVGYIGKRNVTEIFLEGLRRLEYRGYDSAGVAVRTARGRFETRKSIGRIDELAAKLDHQPLRGRCGIGHTRWATHGGVTEENAHPHVGGDQAVIVVHNGVIENYRQLRERLEAEGYVFVSETDTEVIAHLLACFWSAATESNGHAASDDKHSLLIRVVEEALSQLKGTYGLAMLFRDYPDVVIAARLGSPLVVGVGDGEHYIASDSSALAGYTNQVVYLADNELAIITADALRVRHREQGAVCHLVEVLEFYSEDLELGEYPHYMLKEIFEQPAALENAMRGRLSDDDATAIFGGLALTPQELRSVDRILLTGCGTSWHSALVGEYLIEELARLPVEVEYASELRYRNPPMMRGTLAFCISQSGETADTLAALHELKRKGHPTLGICNVVGSTIAREASGGIYLHAGPEIGVASTKAYTSQCLTLAMLALYFGRLHHLSYQSGLRIVKAMRALPDQVRAALDTNNEVRWLAEKYCEATNFLYMGRQHNFPTALEGALKLKEISYIHAEGYPAAEMKHGPIALIDKQTPSLFIIPDSVIYDKILSNVEEVKARGGPVIAIATEGDRRIARLADDVIYVPKVEEFLQPLVSIVPLQLLAYHIALLRGCDVDKPRNLAKSVTVE